MVIDVRTDPADLEVVSRYGWDHPRLPGGDVLRAVGEPALPRRVIIRALPPGRHAVGCRLLDAEWEPVAGTFRPRNRSTRSRSSLPSAGALRSTDKPMP